MHAPKLFHALAVTAPLRHRWRLSLLAICVLGLLSSGSAFASTLSMQPLVGPKQPSASKARVQLLPQLPTSPVASEPRDAGSPTDAADRRFPHDGDLRDALRAGAHFREFDDHAEERRLQILISEVVQDEDGALTLNTRGYRVDREYLYPASAMKHLAAYALFRGEGLTPEQQVRVSDSLVFYERPPAGLSPSALIAFRGQSQRLRVRDVVRRALITSSNDAFNRLYDASGYTALNGWLARVGFHSVRLRHRLYAFEDPVQHLLSPRVEFERDGKIYRVKDAMQDAATIPENQGSRPQLGVRYREPQTREMIDTPMDFSDKNSASLSDLHRSIIALVEPELAPAIDLGLSSTAHDFLLETMSEFPQGKADRGFEQRVDRYKPLLPGVRTVLGDDAVRYINKAGRAYGFHLDTAWIQSQRSGRAVFVTVGTYVNANETLNDDRYEYPDSYALMKELGAWIAEQYLR